MGVHDACQPLQVGEEQVRTFVGGKTTGEAYQQGVWIYLLQHVHDARWVGLVLEPSLLELHLDIVDQFLFQVHAQIPELFIVHIPYFLPYLGIGLVSEERVAKMLLIERLYRRGGPAGEMHAVGDVTHMQFLGK